MTVYQIFPQFSTKIKAVHSTQHAMNSLHSETISFYIFSQKSNAIHPAPLFSFPHPASDPALAFTCTMVKQPFPVYLPVLGVSVPAPSRIFRSATHTHTMNGQAASVQDFRTRYQPPAPPAEGSPPAIPRMSFIRAETVAYTDLVHSGSMLKAKEAGLVRQEGKDYVVKDGDVMLFKFNV